MIGALRVGIVTVVTLAATAITGFELQQDALLSSLSSLSSASLSSESMNRHLQQLSDSLQNLETTNGRHLQTVTRECGEVIGVTPREVLTDLFTAYVDLVVPADVDATNNALFKAGVAANAQYDVVATKICASCEQVLEMYSDEQDLLEADTPNAFATYCGPDKFWHDTVVSGLLWQPYDIATDSFVPGIFKTAITGKQANSSSFFVATERWPSDFVTDFLSLASTPEESASLIFTNLPLLIPGYAATTGIITMFPDTVGYGEDYLGTKGFGTKPGYQVSTVALWLAAKKSIVETTGGCSGLQDSVSLNGYSEGAYAMVAVSAALNELGVEIVNVYAGGGPYNPTILTQETIVNLENGSYSATFHYALALVAHAYSSTNPDQANTGTGQDLLAEEWRDTVVEWIDDGIPGFLVNTLFPADGPLAVVDQRILDAVAAAEAEGFVTLCAPEFAEQFPDLALGELCETLEQNDLTEILLNVPYPVELCHSPEDDVAPFSALPDIDANPNLTLFQQFPVTGDHVDGYFSCMLASFIPFLADARLRGTETAPVATCPSAFATTETCMEDKKTEIIIPRSTEVERLSCSDLAALDSESILFHCSKVKKAVRKCPATCGACLPDDVECSDSTSSGTFKKFDITAVKTCKWLSRKEESGSERLCSSFSRIRLACPKTCGICS